ncbi:MAG: DUF507 family protein [Acidobacteria bacterium]|nr:DUF507 family protein [Acidobacteriota bacterium]
MRLSKDQIELLSFEIIKHLKKEGFIEISKDEKLILEKVANVITEELSIEDRLNEEVREILSKYSDEIWRENAEYHELFKMVKAKLAKERGIIL